MFLGVQCEWVGGRDGDWEMKLDTIQKLLALALDKSTTEHERASAALRAVEGLAAAGALGEVRARFDVGTREKGPGSE